VEFLSVGNDGLVWICVSQSSTVRYLFHEITETSLRRKFNDLLDFGHHHAVFQMPF
jgi:hypothetical protein